MSLYFYVKKTEPDKLTILLLKARVLLSSKRFKQRFSIFLFLIGFILIGNGLLPIINYQIKYAPGFAKVYSPVIKTQVLGSGGDLEEDYTLVSSWFVEKASQKKESAITLVYYNLTVPSLKISNALVNIGGEDLKKSLIHYPDTALPGEYGNTVIFGHSVLPQFFDPSNYLTIFSTLYKLETKQKHGKGDVIVLNYDGVEYFYEVERMFEVEPTDLTVREQRYDDRYLTLITCSPPGTYLRRLIVRARLK